MVGGGVAGLSAAFHLRRAGHTVELIERDDTLGGRFGVGKLGERQVMFGGKNIGRRYISFRAFVAAHGRRDWEPFGINTSRVKDGQVHAVDSSRRLKSLRSLLHAGSPRDLAKLAHLAVRTRSDDVNRFLGSPLYTELARKHDHAPLSAHFGDELTQYLLRPLTVRTNGAEPDEVYLGTFGTNLSLLMDSYDQLTGGIQPVLESFAERVTVRLGTTVEGLVVRDGHVAGLAIADSSGNTREERAYDAVVIATPAYATAEIVRSELPALSERLDDVRYFPSNVALVEYDRPVFTPEVRALALDEGPCSNAGSYGADDRHVVRYTFSGREARVADPSHDRFAAWVDEGEEVLMRYVPSARDARRVSTATRHWPAAYCAYVPFHGEFLADVHRAIDGLPGLELAGDYLRGAAIEACFRSGTEAAVRLGSSLGEATAGAAAAAALAGASA